MADSIRPPSIDEWLTVLRSEFEQTAPDLLPLFNIYAGEAQFGRTYIAQDLARLDPGASVLEVGAGATMLSCQLVREGYAVTALEPTGEGFSHFDRMREIVLTQARALGCCPDVLNLPAEALSADARFDFAFSVNVMEHVDDVKQVLANVSRSLQPGAHYRFTCPNYLFPYEPHFNIPTLFSKPLTAKVLHKTIFGSTRVSDPAGTWASLNWITVQQVRRYTHDHDGIHVKFNRTMLVDTLERVVSDPGFAARRSPAMRQVLGLAVRLRAHKLLGLLPARLQPIMDCTIVKTDTQRAS